MNDEQSQLYDILRSGINTFITGPGGCGKTYILNYFINWYKNNIENSNNKIYVTSTTGTSALLLNGITVHSYSGIANGEKELDYYLKRFNSKKYKYIKNRWLNTKILIIDEISMMHPDMFIKLDEIGKNLRENDKPFGGIQLIVSGDFCQLPPIGTKKYCFEADNWNSVIEKSFYLKKNVRQHNENDNLNIFIDVLNDIRYGIVTPLVKKVLNSCLNKKLENDYKIEPTILFPRKKDVREYNQLKIGDLMRNEETKEFQATYTFDKKISVNEQFIYKEKINNTYHIDDTIVFTNNCQVMLTINKIENGLSNGSRGVIIGFNPYPVVQFLDGKIMMIEPNEWKIEEGERIITKKQIPLIYAWAITVHKSQGTTIDYLVTDIGSSIFEAGQVYVALSRVKSVDGLSITNINFSRIRSNPTVIAFYESIN